jgi:hypothetical protein
MSTTSAADIISALDGFQKIVQQGIRDGTVLDVMKRERKAIVGGAIAS